MAEQPGGPGSNRLSFRYKVAWWVGLTASLTSIAGFIVVLILWPDSRTHEDWLSGADGICEEEMPNVMPALNAVVDTWAEQERWLKGEKKNLTVSKATEFSLRGSNDLEKLGQTILKMNGRLRAIPRPSDTKDEIEKTVDSGAKVYVSITVYAENVRNMIPRTPEWDTAVRQTPSLKRKMKSDFADWKLQLKDLGTSQYCWGTIGFKEDPTESPIPSSS
ncbi:hypothetical protein ACIQK5_02930 [Streptomyces virginiae]|uniref:hypothetical protein n=1 Tax=Streptomyces TaxID=1883 RepID=UPI0013721912|nr:hypothetical protein [Streptomyces sp. SID1046]MYV74602.1 hypothetical protein [Streptomyces sp. SID1046]